MRMPATYPTDIEFRGALGLQFQGSNFEKDSTIIPQKVVNVPGVDQKDSQRNFQFFADTNGITPAGATKVRLIEYDGQGDKRTGLRDLYIRSRSFTVNEPTRIVGTFQMWIDVEGVKFYPYNIELYAVDSSGSSVRLGQYSGEGVGKISVDYKPPSGSAYTQLMVRWWQTSDYKYQTIPSGWASDGRLSANLHWNDGIMVYTADGQEVGTGDYIGEQIGETNTILGRSWSWISGFFDQLLHLFVPDEADLDAMQTSWTNLLADKFGFVYQLTYELQDFLEGLKNPSNVVDGSITIPAMPAFKVGDVDVQLWSEPLSLSIGNNPVVETVRPAMNTLVLAVSTWGFVRGMARTWSHIIGGKSEADLDGEDDGG